MAVLKVGALMRYYINNQPHAIVHGTTVMEALQDAVAQYPALKFHILDSNGKIRRHINIFVNNENIRDLKGVKTRVRDDDQITLLASISGG